MFYSHNRNILFGSAVNKKMFPRKFNEGRGPTIGFRYSSACVWPCFVYSFLSAALRLSSSACPHSFSVSCSTSPLFWDTASSSCAGESLTFYGANKLCIKVERREILHRDSLFIYSHLFLRQPPPKIYPPTIPNKRKSEANETSREFSILLRHSCASISSN